jgi:hypothetical protein
VTAEWTEGRYGGFSLNLELFVIYISWGMTSNSKGVNGWTWKSSTGATSAPDVRFNTFDEAKERAERWARKALARATALCPAARTPGTSGAAGGEP